MLLVWKLPPDTAAHRQACNLLLPPWSLVRIRVCGACTSGTQGIYPSSLSWSKHVQRKQVLLLWVVIK
ncbi:hypothetical protein BDA96_08G029600 [Sorghum bicolor]|uniref:Uncharacterized protein n=1 Tax=Sorghum bicolor TaxID=4558 RepID=A0A921QD95_SORBI|nr:hypothetical protein BDA96_08G029600 [Sorghum bicolor]